MSIDDATVRPPDPPRAEPVRAQTLVLLRWVAILGQLAAVSVAWLIGLRFPVLPVLCLILAAAILNLWLMRSPPARMSPGRVVAQLTFDLTQISALIALTGGVSNPFALLVLAPVTIAATVMGTRQTVLLGTATVILFSLAALWAQPLTDSDGNILQLPRLLALGHWLAIVIGVGFFAAYTHRVTAEMYATETALFATQMALAREQRLQHLGGVVAAAAHEMGTPLATIKLIAAEMTDELSDRPDLAPDLQALRDSADRCARILRSMGRAGKDDLLLHSAPLRTLLDEAAAPHADRGARVDISADDVSIRRDPAIIHGLRNLIQNAVDFAEARVTISAAREGGRVAIRIQDDGPGFPPSLLQRIGDPYPTMRRPGARRKGYEGMGLGLFIAKALLERTGADLDFRNGTTGAIVIVAWPEDRIIVNARQALGENPRFDG